MLDSRNQNFSLNFFFGSKEGALLLKYCFPILRCEAYATDSLAGFATVGAEAAYFGSGYRNFYAAVAGDLAL